MEMAEDYPITHWVPQFFLWKIMICPYLLYVPEGSFRLQIGTPKQVRATSCSSSSGHGRPFPIVVIRTSCVMMKPWFSNIQVFTRSKWKTEKGKPAKPLGKLHWIDEHCDLPSGFNTIFSDQTRHISGGSSPIGCAGCELRSPREAYRLRDGIAWRIPFLQKTLYWSMIYWFTRFRSAAFQFLFRR